MTRRVEALPTAVRGRGPTVVLLHGFALSPSTYGATTDELARHVRVVVPHLFAGRNRFSFAETSRRLEATLDEMEVDAVTLLGHSFGGGIALEFAARWPERVRELVFVDTLGLSGRWQQVRNTFSGPGLLRLATVQAARDFARTVVTHPAQVARAAWRSFVDPRTGQLDRVAEAGLPAHVLWANRDTLLSRSDGRAFAAAIGADFHVVSGTGRTDHDWVFRRPALVVPALAEVGVEALAGSPRRGAQPSVIISG